MPPARRLGQFEDRIDELPAENQSMPRKQRYAAHKTFEHLQSGGYAGSEPHVRLSLEPGETREVIYLLGYHENPPDQKFDPPESQSINKRTVSLAADRALPCPRHWAQQRQRLAFGQVELQIVHGDLCAK
jgi:hypothetical protein